MSDVKPRVKHIEYERLSARIDYAKREMILTDNSSGESITISHEAYGELQAILMDLGRQIPAAITNRR